MSHKELELLKRYLQGNATPDEQQHIRHWLVRHEDDEDVKQLLQKEWRLTSTDNELDLNMEEAWSEFKQKLNLPAGQREKLDETLEPGRPSGMRSFKIASFFFIAVLISGISLFLFFLPAGQESIERVQLVYTTKKTNRGEKLNISLPDGSFIKLNSSSQLQIPDNYSSSNERVVYLEGEAFFEIARNEHKPFKVISGGVTTQVLGTSFNVNTFSDRAAVNVAVVTGKVRVANNTHEIILYPKEMSTMGPATKVPVKEAFDVESVTGWRNNVLIFDKVLFEEIIEKIEQWYGVEFIIEGKPYRTGKYSGRFENKSLESVLEGLGFSSAFEYKIVDKTVYLKFK